MLGISQEEMNHYIDELRQENVRLNQMKGDK